MAAEQPGPAAALPGARLPHGAMEWQAERTEKGSKMTIRELIDAKMDVDLELRVNGEPVTCACKQSGALSLETYVEESPAQDIAE